MAKIPQGRKVTKVGVYTRINKELHADVVARDAHKFQGGYTEIVERLLVGQMRTKRGLAHKFSPNYVRRNGK